MKSTILLRGVLIFFIGLLWKIQPQLNFVYNVEVFYPLSGVVFIELFPATVPQHHNVDLFAHLQFLTLLDKETE